MFNLYIKLFIPQVIFIFKAMFLGIVSKIKMKFTKVNMVSIKENKIIVIGNGPSFKETYNKNFEALKQNACIVVNNFVDSNYFEQLTPQYYIIVDPNYFLPIEKLSDRLKNVVESLQTGLTKKVKWPMNVILPFSANGTNFHKRLLSNKYIKICFFNNKGQADVFPNNGLKYFLWNHDILTPLAQTVLNVAISLAVKNKIKEIYLVGADTSWHENYELDQETNVLYYKDTHFYGNKKFPIYEDAKNKVSVKIHNELRTASIALQAYWILYEYSLYNNVNIYNASAYSWIDAFKRKKLNKL